MEKNQFIAHPSSFAISALAVCLVMATATANAQKLDTELLLLVDVSGSVSTSEYDLMMGGYANAFRSASVLESIRSGENGAIAVSLAFWSGHTQQSIGLDWMKISDEDSAYAFASAMESLKRPFSGSTAIASAIDYGTTLFGSETGGKDNGFESLVQVIDVGGDGEDNASAWSTSDKAAAVRFARDNALAAGVDMINGLPIGVGAGDLVAYYANNVIGGSAGGTKAFVQPTATFADVQKGLEQKLTREISAAAEQSIVLANSLQAVPEPKAATLLLLSSLLIAFRRRKP